MAGFNFLENIGWVGGIYGGGEQYMLKYRQIASRFIENFTKYKLTEMEGFKAEGPKI